MASRTTKPIGALVRQQPDWRMDDFSLGSFGAPPATNATFNYISLFNNDNLGRKLVVWHASFSVDTFNFLYLYLYQGTRGVKVPSCINIDPTNALLIGQMYNDQSSTKYTDIPVYTGGTLIFSNWPPVMPSIVIPAGWSLGFGSDLNGAFTAFAAWFLPTGVT